MYIIEYFACETLFVNYIFMLFFLYQILNEIIKFKSKSPDKNANIFKLIFDFFVKEVFGNREELKDYEGWKAGLLSVAKTRFYIGIFFALIFSLFMIYEKVNLLDLTLKIVNIHICNS